MFAFLVFHQQIVDIVLGVLFFGMTGYFQYRAIRDLRLEVGTAARPRKLPGNFFGLIGIIAFAAMVQLLYILSLLEVDPRWSGGLVWITMGLIVIGFLIGNRVVGRIGRKGKR